ncbi:terminase large subunit [Rhodococcus phage NiceHouse]|nr:terminase large subunit [Rhodococcus phage NiceHouse]
MSNYNDFLEALNPSDFDETPVDVDTFLYDKHYMGVYTEGIKLSPVQRDIVIRGSQIYYHDTLKELHGAEIADDMWENTIKNLLLMLGKGSGKDFVARLTVLYIVYKLLCLKSPARYFKKPGTDPIDIINMALNAPQAKTVFFDPLIIALKTSPWFAGKYYDRSTDVKFDKNITVYSLHSSFEAAEGKNIMIAVLDEIDGFTVEGYADEVFKAISGTVTSRFPETGKLITLSFPRSKDGFMMRKYREVVDEVDTVEYSHEYLLNEKVDRDEPGNLLTVSWTEDTVLSYSVDNFYALKAPTFRVNPNCTIEGYRDDFVRDHNNNESDTLMRVCANPPDHDAASFFTNHEKIESTFSVPNGWENGEVKCPAVPDAEYFIHVDLSKVSDRTVVGLGHVSSWIEPDIHARVHTDAQPFITIDLFRIWEPTRLKPVDDAEVMDFIMLLCKKFNVRKVTFDQWQSFDNINYLESVGVPSEKFSLKREEYTEFRTALSEGRMVGPLDEKLWKELKNLIIVKGKIDHPPGKEHFNDISEAVCGVTANCIRNTIRNTEIQLITMESLTRDARTLEEQAIRDNIEKPDMPDELIKFMDGWKAL